MLAALRRQGLNRAESARLLGRHRSTVCREVRRNSTRAATGLIRQYLPKGESMAGLSQHRCNAIARRLNTRPRKRLGFRTPLERYNESSVSVALQT